MGDSAGFEQMYRAHVHRVYTHCVRRLGAIADAEDVVSQTFTAAWMRWEEITLEEYEGGVLPWLLATANNIIRARLRETKRRREILRRWATPFDEPDFSESVADRALQDQNLARVRRVLGLLSESDQDVIWLCAIEGLSPASVATQLGLSAGTVRSRLSRALARARARYDVEYNASFPDKV